MANVNRILIKSKSSAAGAPSTSDIQVGELAVNTVTGLTYLGTNSSNTGLAAGGTPTEISTIGMPVDTSGSLGSSDVKLATQNAIKTYVDTATAANRDIDALDALSSVGNIHQTDDHFLISDDGTEKKITFSDLEDEIFGNISSDITVAAGGAATIGDNKVGADELNVSGDGTSSQFLRSDGDGTFTWATPSTGTATAMTVADESSDTTCFPLFVTAATGDLAPKSGSNLLFDSADGVLAATTFSGNLTGNVTGSLIIGGHTMADVDIGTEFNDVDDHLMSSGAIKEKIEGYSYITASSSDTLSNKTIAASQVTEISNLTAVEGAQLENIDSTTISATQWGYLGAASGAITNTDTDVTNANLLTRLAALESSGGSGDENITIGTDSGDTIVITGNLQVSGTTTTVNSTTVNLNDHNIVLDSGNSTSAVVDGAGITLEGGSGDDATFTYSTTGPQFEMKLGSSYEDLQVAKLTATELDISGDADIDGTLEADAITVGGTALNTVIAGVTVTNATTAAVATTVTITDNESTDEDNPIVFVAGGDLDGGNLGLESDGTAHYNPSSGKITATAFAGALTGNVTGNADTSTKIASITNSDIVQLTSSQTLTNKVLTSPDINTPDIDGGTIDGATIATSDVTVGSSKTLDVSAGTLTTSTAQKKAIVEGVGSNFDVGNVTMTANGVTIDGTFTDGTMSIASGAITSATIDAGSYTAA